MRTCGLKCVAAHKERTGCSGARDVGEFVPLNKFTSTQLRRDLQFLTECSRATETARRALPRIAWRYTFRALPPPLHALRDVAKRHGVLCQILSEGMERRRRNTSRYDAKARQIIWHLEARFVSAATVTNAAAAAAAATAAVGVPAESDAATDGTQGASLQPQRSSALVPQPPWDFTVESAWAQERFMLQDILHYCWAMRPMLPRIDNPPSAARLNRRRQREEAAPHGAGEEAGEPCEAPHASGDVGVVDAAEQAEINAALQALDAPYVEAAAAANAAAAERDGAGTSEAAAAEAAAEAGIAAEQAGDALVAEDEVGAAAAAQEEAEGDVVFVSARAPTTDAPEAAEQPVIESVSVLQPTRGAVAAGVSIEADVADAEAKTRVTDFFQRCLAACAPSAAEENANHTDDFRGYAVFALVERLQDDRVYQRLDPMRTVQEAARQIFFVNEYPVLYVVQLPRLAPEAVAPGASGDDTVDWAAMHAVFPPASREHLERMRASLRRGAAQHAVARAHQNAASAEGAEPADPEAAAAAAAARSMFTKPYAELTEEERTRLARLPCKNFLRGRCNKRSAAGAGPGSPPLELAENIAAAEAAGEELCPYWHCEAAALPLCRSMVRDGECPHGPRCSFSHNPDRLREVWVQQPPRFGPYSADARQAGRGGFNRGRGGDRGGRGRGRGHY
jgi:hypothetical protein